MVVVFVEIARAKVSRGETTEKLAKENCVSNMGADCSGALLKAA
jgi:hypothetical protein